MMPQNKTKRILPKAAISALLLLYGNMALAQSSSAGSHDKVTVGEIFMYIALIVGVILVAWFLVGRTSGDSPKQNANTQHPNAPRRHYDHPNDPHFRKLKKKTS